MTRNDIDRRKFILGAAAATLAGTAGCSGDDDSSQDGMDGTPDDEGTPDDGTPDEGTPDDGTPDEGTPDEGTPDNDTGEIAGDDEIQTMPGETPAYAQWFDADGDQHIVVQTDFAAAQGTEAYAPLFEAGNTDTGNSGPPFPAVDSIAEEYPASSGFTALLIVGFAAGRYPFLQRVGFDGVSMDQDIANPVATIEQATISVGVSLTGDVDEDAIQAAESVQEADSYNGYTIYESTAQDGSVSPFAVQDDTIIVPIQTDLVASDDMRVVLEFALDAAADGGGTGSENLSWLLDHCGDGAFVYGGADLESEPLFGAGSFDAGTLNADQEEIETFASLTSNISAGLLVAEGHEDGRVTRSGFVFPGADSTPDWSDLVGVLAGGASERNVMTDGDRIVVEAFWE